MSLKKRFPPYFMSTYGGVISPILANITLDHLEWFLEEKGYLFVRYADDCAPRTLMSLLIKDAA
jgi:retron-type reverse transcriptase